MLRPRDMVIVVFALATAAMTAPAQVSANAIATVTGTDPNHCVTESTIYGIRHRCALVVTISKTSTSSAQKISLPIKVAKVALARVTPGAHLVIIGKRVGNYDNFVVYDLPSAHLIVNRLCYFPALSPDGTWIVYQRFIPPHGMEGLSVDVEMFPVDAMQRGRDSYSVFRTTPIPDASRASRPTPTAWPFSPFFWSTDSSLILTGISGNSGEYLLLIRRIKRKRQPFIASTAKIDLAKLCDRNDLANNPGHCLLHIEKVTFPSSKSGSIQITFKRSGRLGQDQTITKYNISRFIPVTSPDTGDLH